MVITHQTGSGAKAGSAPRVARAIEALTLRIGAGEWQVGTRIPGETTLAAELGVGRSTIREATRELAAQGMLRSRQGYGVVVTSLVPVDELTSVVEQATIAAVIEARTAIEVQSAYLAAERRTAQDLHDLRIALADRERSLDEPELLLRHDAEVHRGVVVAAHNDILLELFDMLAPRVESAMRTILSIGAVPPSRPDHLQHVAVVDAIAAGDRDLARDLTLQHLALLKSLVREG